MSDVITKSECIEIVRNSLKDKDFDERWIKSFTVELVTEGLVGFMGEYYKLFVELEECKVPRSSSKLSFFMKSLPILNEVFRNDCLEKGFFTKETQLYANLLGELQKYASKKMYPECYYTRSDLIVLEDLSTQPLRHLTSDDDRSIDFYKVVLRNQAYLHATSIAYEVDTGINIGEKFKNALFELQLIMSNLWCATGVKGIVSLAKRIPKYHNTPVEEFINNKLFDILSSACRLAEPSDVYRNVLCHRDTWTRNIFFKCDANNIPTDSLLVDFQLTKYSPPAIDVLSFISMATRKKQRLLIQEECLDFYYNTFAEIMTDMDLKEEMISRKEFSESCHRLELPVFIIRAICVPFTKMQPGLGSKLRAENSEKFDYYLNVDREELFLRVIDIDPGYEEEIFEPVEEILEYLIKELKLL